MIMFNPDSFPFRVDEDKRSRASKEDYISECEMVEAVHQTSKIMISAFDNDEY